MPKAIMVAGVLAAGSLLSAQGPQPPVDRSVEGALLSEVRALRAEIAQVSSAGIRAQLLVARLQLQEQRVFTVARQLTDAQNAVTTVRSEINGELSRIRQLEEAATRASSQGRMAIQQAILEAGTQVDQQRQKELQLRAREEELLKAMNDAQQRWAEFNERLDTLERSLPAGALR